MSTITIHQTGLKLGAFLGALIFMSIWTYFYGPAIWYLAGIAVGVYALSYRLEWGWYVLVALAPFIHLQLFFNRFAVVANDFPWLASMNAPLADVWAVVLISALGIFFLRQFFSGQKISLRAPFLFFFSLFVASAVLSLGGQLFSVQSLGVKYLAHFLLLFYLGYFIVGANIVSSVNIWRQSLGILAGVGFLGAFMGFMSLPLGLWAVGGFRRAVPFALGGIFPFGDQHIFLAEVITVAVPIFAYFYSEAKTLMQKKFYAVTGIFVLLIGLLTLSRAAWVTLAVMGVVWVALFWRKFSLAGIARKYWWLVGILLALVGYFTYFISVSSAVAGSNTTRWMLTDIAWRMFLRRPWTGIGVGSFVPSVGESYAFFLDFGGPQDAHGILQKIGTEQGMIGVLAFVGFIGAIIWALWQAYRRAQSDVVVRRAYLLSIFLVMAVLVFQIFNTQYYSGKFWAPLALAVISLYIFKSGSNQNRLSS